MKLQYKVHHDTERPLSRARLIPTQLLTLAYNILFDVKFIRASLSQCESLYWLLQKFLKYIRKNNNTYMLVGVLSALKNFMFSRKPFEWVPCFPARVFISPTSITPTFESFSLQLFLRETLNGQSSRSLSLIISEASVLRFSVTDSGGGMTVVTGGAPQRKVNFRSKGFWWPSNQNKENAVINIGLVRRSPPQWPKVGCGQPNRRYNKKPNFYHA